MSIQKIYSPFHLVSSVLSKSAASWKIAWEPFRKDHRLSSRSVLLLKRSSLVVRDRSLLGLNLCNATLDIGALPIALVHARDEVRSIGEQVVHLLERTLGGLR